MKVLLLALLLVTAAAHADPRGDYELAKSYRGLTGQRFDPERALAHLRKSAEGGYLPAQVDLAFMHFNGSSPVARDPAAAFPWFQKAAQGGSPIATCMMGDFFRQGIGGVKKDEVAAVRWYRRGAKLQDRCAPKAQYELYVSYESGRGVRKDLPTAMAWLKQAAVAGNPRAQAALGRHYDKGYGVEKDTRLGKIWWLRSREGVAPHDDHDHATPSCPPWMKAEMKVRAGCV